MGLLIIAGIILFIFGIAKASKCNTTTSNPNLTNLNNKFGIGNNNVILVSAGKYKISVLKEIRDILNCGLVEGKNIVDSAPITLLSNISEYAAVQIKNTLEKVGANIDISCTDNNLINIIENESDPEFEVDNETKKNENIIKIKQLAELKEQGIITEEEFENKKLELLNRI